MLQSNYGIKFAISSHLDYVNKTRRVLEPSLIRAGVSPDDIYFFIYDPVTTDYLKVRPGTYLIPHNSLDYNGLISVLELDLKNSWWFLLHDTTYVGPEFLNRLNGLNLVKEATVPLSIHSVYPGGSMGLYSWEFLLKNKQAILNLKNTSKETSELHKHKTKLVNFEDGLFKDAEWSLNNRQAPIVTSMKDFYCAGTIRQVEHFDEIDLYKVKANWNGPQNTWTLKA